MSSASKRLKSAFVRLIRVVRVPIPSPINYHLQNHFIMKQLFFTILFAVFLLPLAAQSPSPGETPACTPKYEVRAAWVTAVYGLDWPRSRATTPEGVRKQKAELIEILDRLKAANFNTVLFQTRTRGDVLYRSKIEPFNSILTGKTAGDPGYDPLAFAVEECHKRGMEIGRASCRERV